MGKQNENEGIIYYTDNRLPEHLNLTCQKFIKESGLPITSSSLKPIDFGDNEVIDGQRSYPTMVRQIISCLKRSKSKYVFFCEHDVLYPESHFDFTPERDDIFYYNQNVWRWYYGKEKAIQHDRMWPLSAMCVNREFALKHYLMRQQKIEEWGYDHFRSREPRLARIWGYEPGLKKIKRGGFSDDDYGLFNSKECLVDIRHSKTFSSPKIDLKDFKHKPKWWVEKPIQDIEDWNLKSLFNL